MKVRKLFKRYFIDAMGAMALGLFSSLIIGLIISQLGQISFLSFLTTVSDGFASNSAVIGAVIAISVSWGLKTRPLTMFSCGAIGAIGYVAGGPVGAYVGAIIGSEVGEFVYKKTPADIIIVPLATIISGGLVANFVGPYINDFMLALGQVINTATELSRLPMGLAVGAIVGMVLTLPISSAALCIMLQISGLAAGAAVAGCSAQMVGFAAISFKDNGFNGLFSQGLGTSMLQVPNIMKKPVIWIAPTIAGAVAGAFSTSSLFNMTCSSYGAGMGTSGLVGQIGTITTMSESEGLTSIIIKILVVQIIIPVVVSLAVDFVLRKKGIVKEGDMKILNV